ncbi:MAG: arsenate reductase (glutaredoxin) [Cyclobacteriaceae bacterium]
MVEILHNPRCRKSREALQLLEEKNVEHTVIDYQKEPLTVEKLTEVISQLGIQPESLLRKGEAIYKEQYKGKQLSDLEWIEAMVEHPKLMERPIIIANGKAVVARPAEKINEVI